jgi:predicted ATPase
METHDLALCGWRVWSELPLPGMDPWQGPDRAVDLRVTLGAVPASLPGEIVTGLYMRVAPDGRVLFNVPGIARYLIETSDHVVVAPEKGGDPQDVSVLFTGAVFGMLCHMRDRLPLHASAIDVHGRAMVIAGESGAGKSTLAAAMAAAGFRLLADDVAVVASVDGTPWIVPGGRVQKLWQDSQEALRLSAGRELRTIQDRSKYEHRAVDFLPDRVPLGAVFHLSRARDPSDAMLERQSPQRAFHTIWSNIYRDHAARTLGLANRLFLDCGRIAAAVPCFTLRRTDDFGSLDALKEALVSAAK